jgi:hypothetical protein
MLPANIDDFFFTTGALGGDVTLLVDDDEGVAIATKVAVFKTGNNGIHSHRHIISKSLTKTEMVRE